jgi:hypothetical protein
VWLTFTHRPIDGSSAVFVDTEPPLDRWHRGVRYEVFIRGRRQPPRGNRQPGRLRADPPPLRLAVQSGRRRPAMARATRFPAKLPHPPPDRDVQEVRGGRAQRAALDTHQQRETRGSGDGRDRGTEDSRSSRGGRGEHDPRARGGDHRNDHGEHEPGRRKDDKGRRASRRGYSSGREGFTWPSARDDDNGDDNYDHPGHGKLSSASSGDSTP